MRSHTFTVPRVEPFFLLNTLLLYTSLFLPVSTPVVSRCPVCVCVCVCVMYVCVCVCVCDVRVCVCV